MKLLSLTSTTKIGNNSVINTFTVIGIADISRNIVKFQGLLNGVPFTQSLDFEKVRARVLSAHKLNQKEGAN